MAAEDMMQKLGRWYDHISERASDLEAVHGERLHCREGCSACCIDDLTVYEVEADYIRKNATSVLAKPPHAPGACAFLDDHGACRIYPFRPYVCRTQGLPLRWLENAPNEPDAWIEYRDICPLNEEGLPLENLPEEVCWTIGEPEQFLASCQKAHGNGKMTRVPLRSLFSKEEDGH